MTSAYYLPRRPDAEPPAPRFAVLILLAAAIGALGWLLVAEMM